MESNFGRNKPNNQSNNQSNNQQNGSKKRNIQNFSVNPPKKPATSEMTIIREGFSGGVIKKEIK